MSLRIVAGTANIALAAGVAARPSCELTPCEVERFPDGEVRPVVANVRGDDVYVVEPTGPPVSENVVELLLLLDACRRAGAGRVTAVVPYFGYARQDPRSKPGEAVGARVIADGACLGRRPAVRHRGSAHCCAGSDVQRAGGGGHSCTRPCSRLLQRAGRGCRRRRSRPRSGQARRAVRRGRWRARWRSYGRPG